MKRGCVLKVLPGPLYDTEKRLRGQKRTEVVICHVPRILERIDAALAKGPMDYRHLANEVFGPLCAWPCGCGYGLRLDCGVGGVCQSPSNSFGCGVEALPLLWSIEERVATTVCCEWPRIYPEALRGVPLCYGHDLWFLYRRVLAKL